MSNAARPQGLQQWEDWLNTHIKPWGVVLKNDNDPQTRDAIWRVGFPDDPRAQIRVTEEALLLSEGDFEALVIKIERLVFLGRMIAASPGGIRIHADGEIEEMDREEPKREIE